MNGTTTRRGVSETTECGMSDALSRIEAKLDALLEAMAEDEESEIGATSLDEKGESRRPATL